MPSTEPPGKALQHPLIRALWTTLGVTVLVAVLVVYLLGWTWLWIAAVAAAVAFPLFLGANALLAKYASPPDEER